ncbi:MAG: iron-containing alcohol dehydrogenase, partial [Parvibaculum sp.]
MVQTGEVQCSTLEKVIFGEPAARALAAVVERLGATRVFLLASATLDRETDEIAAIRRTLGSKLAAVYTGMPAHTPRPAVLAAAEAARAVNTDLVVTLGGGSVTDAGKVMLVALTHDIQSAEDFEPFHVRVEADGTVIHPVFAGPAIRSIAIPTTLSGGEFNPLGGATDLKKNLKEGYEHADLAPRIVILDPALTRHTPEWLWLSTGVRA